jgi:hypothetical protein
MLKISLTVEISWMQTGLEVHVHQIQKPLKASAKKDLKETGLKFTETEALGLNLEIGAIL